LLNAPWFCAESIAARPQRSGPSGPSGPFVAVRCRRTDRTRRPVTDAVERPVRAQLGALAAVGGLVDSTGESAALVGGRAAPPRIR
jgi:hypothetical protein